MMISVLAVFIMIGAPMCLIMVFAPFPAAILGLILHGWVKAAVFLVYGALMAAAGVGLWRLEEWARRLALAMQVVGLAQLVLYIIRPSLITDYSAEVNQAMNVPQPQSPAQLQTMMYDVSFGFGALLFVAIVWILIHYRGVFRHPNAPAQIESPA
jgi:NADH:ubiquinone oxidoreductase subunit 5 (subunit L)/multisubunit Na+/H+ antiporter MnhA subunit